LKEKQPKYIFIKNVKPRVDKNDRPNNHIYQYRNINKTKITYMPKGGNKVFHRGPNGWSYEIKNKKVFQQNDKTNVAS
jgi:hypothetical protein